MYSKNSFGNFYPIDSALHRLNPIVKIINFLIAIAILILSMSFEINMFMFSLVFIMTLLSFVPTKFYFQAFYSLRYLYILVVFICLFLGIGLQSTIIYLLKIVTIVEYLFILIYTTSSSELSYGIEKILNIFNIFGLNMARISVSITNILKFIPLLITTDNKILKSASSRGIDYNHSGFFGRVYAILKSYANVFRIAFKKNKDIKRVGESKLFNIRKKRTNYRTNKVGFYDLMFFLFHVFIIVTLLIERGVLNEILVKLNL